MLPSEKPVTDSPTLQPIDTPILAEDTSNVQEEGIDEAFELELSSSESRDVEFTTEEYGDILDEDINAYLDFEPMSFPMVEVPTSMPTTGTEEGDERGEMISNELQTVDDDPPETNNELWIIAIVFGVGFLLAALYVTQSRRRIAHENENERVVIPNGVSIV